MFFAMILDDHMTCSKMLRFPEATRELADYANGFPSLGIGLRWMLSMVEWFHMIHTVRETKMGRVSNDIGCVPPTSDVHHPFAAILGPKFLEHLPHQS